MDDKLKRLRIRSNALVALADDADAAVIREAAYAARMTVSTFLLLAALEKAAKQAQANKMGEGE